MVCVCVHNYIILMVLISCQVTYSDIVSISFLIHTVEPCCLYFIIDLLGLLAVYLRLSKSPDRLFLEPLSTGSIGGGEYWMIAMAVDFITGYTTREFCSL